MSQTIFEKNRPSDAEVAASVANSKLGSFWLDDVEQRPALPSLMSARSTDLAIVGGGYLGLWTAVLAKERSPSRRVTLLEAHRTGHAASGRNGGFCEASITHGRRVAGGPRRSAPWLPGEPGGSRQGARLEQACGDVGGRHRLAP